MSTAAASARTYPWLFSDVVVARSGELSKQGLADLRRGDSFGATS